MADRVHDDASAAVAAEAGAAPGDSPANVKALPAAAARHNTLRDQETPRKSHGRLHSVHAQTTRMRTPEDEQPKATAAIRGCLTARHWQDIRQAARLARCEGITLILHGVTVSPHVQEKTPDVAHINMTTTAVLDRRGQKPKESIGNACEHLSEKQQQQQPTKKQREQQRSLGRLRTFNQAKACGARWQPLVQLLLRRDRANLRDIVWTAHMRHKLALRDKMCDFLGRVLHHTSSRADPAVQAKSPALYPGCSDRFRHLATKYRHLCNLRAAGRVMKRLKDFFRYYRKTLNLTLAYHIVPFTHTDLLTGTVHEVTRPHELSPPGRRPHTPPDSPANRRAPKKGSRSRRR